MATAAAVTGGDHNLQPGLKVKALTITMDSSYKTIASGGETVDLSSYFPTKVLGLAPITDCDGWILSYELATSGAPTSGKILARNVTSTLDKALFPECDAGTDLTGVAGVFLAFGY